MIGGHVINLRVTRVFSKNNHWFRAYVFKQLVCIKAEFLLSNNSVHTFN